MAEPHQSRVYSDLARFYDFFFGRVFVDREHEVIESLKPPPRKSRARSPGSGPESHLTDIRRMRTWFATRSFSRHAQARDQKGRRE